MKFNWLVQSVVVLAAAAIGYGIAHLQYVWSELDEPVVVSKERMAELLDGECGGDLAEKSAAITAVRMIFDDPYTSSQDFDVTLVKDGDGRSCIFDYALSGDSYVQGRGVARFSDEHTLTRIDFFNWLDTNLINESRPSFSVFLYKQEGTALIFESLHDQLYILDDRKVPIVRSLSVGF